MLEWMAGVGWWLFSDLAMFRQAKENGYSGHIAQIPVKKTPGKKRPPLPQVFEGTASQTCVI